MSVKGVVSGYLNFIQMPTGRYLFALKAIQEQARGLALGAVEEAARVALEKGQEAQRLEFSYEQTREKSSSARGNAMVLDNQLDALISAIKAVVDARTLGDEHDPVVQAARRVLAVVFPRGVSPIIHQSFEVQLGIMDVMLEQFGGDLAQEMSLLGLEREVGRMERLVEEFRAELSRAANSKTAYADVREAREVLHEYVALVFIQALAAYPGLSRRMNERRRALLEPLFDQQERVREAYRRRRAPRDVDPATGEELPGSEPLDDDEEMPEVIVPSGV